MTLILSGTDGVSDVDGSAATPAVRGSDTNTGIFFPAADTIAFSEGGVEAARITNTAAWSFGSSGTATGTNGQVLTSAGSAAAPTWANPATVNLTTGVTGTLPVSNGGTNSTATPIAGTVPYGTGTALAYTSAGTSGQILQSNGASAPTWITPSAGAVTLISTATASGSASLAFTGLTTAYAYYFIEYDSLVASSAGPLLEMYVSSDNGATYKGSSQYKYTNYVVTLSAANRSSANTGGYFAVAAEGNGMGTAADGAFGGGIVYIYSPAANSCTFTWQTMNRNSTTLDTQFGAGGLVTNGLAAVNAIKFQAAGVTITGNFRLYGVAKT